MRGFASSEETMMHTLLASVLTMALAGAAFAGQGPSKDPANDQGRQLFMTYCASCHGPSAQGDGPAASALKVPPADLTAMARNNGGTFPTAKATRAIRGPIVGSHGSLEMPVWGDAFRKRDGLSDAAVTDRIYAI